MTKHEIREYLKVLKDRLARTQTVYDYDTETNAGRRAHVYIRRLQNAIYDFEYDLAPQHRERDIPSYEDCQELHQPCEHLGDDWKNNEDI